MIASSGRRRNLAWWTIAVLLLQALSACQPSSQHRLETVQTYLDQFGRTGDPAWRDRAIAELRREVREKPSSGAYLLLCITLNDRAVYEGDEHVLPEARAACESAVAADPSAGQYVDPPAYTAGLTYMNIAARLPAKESRAYYDRAIEEFQTVIREQPELGGAHIQLGRIYRWRNQKELALFEAREAVRLAPQSASAHLFMGLVSLDRAHNQRGKCHDDEALSRATASLKEAVRLEPKWAEPHRSLSLAFEHLGHIELALFEAERAHDLEGGPLDLERLGSALMKAGRPNDAEQSLLAAREQAPRYIGTYEMLASLHLQQGRFEEAARHYAEAIALSGTETRFDTALHYYLTLRELGREAEAKRTLEAYRDNGETRFETSLADHYLGRISDEELAEAVANDCERARLYFHRAYAQRLAKRLDAARVGFELALLEFDGQLCSTERLLTQGRLARTESVLP